MGWISTTHMVALALGFPHSVHMCIYVYIIYRGSCMQPIGANIKKPGSGVAETGPSLRERVSPFSCEFLQNVHLAARKRNETKNAKEKAKMHCSFHKICQSPEKHTKIYQVTFWKEKEEGKKQPCPLVDGCILSSVFPMIWLHCNPNSCSVKVMQSSG